ncbi:MAG: TolC family protein [bacterium]|nr:TolC family protein [bacterium]
MFILSLSGLSAEEMDMEGCLRLALSNSPGIKKQRNTIIQYEYKIKQAISSFYPTIHLSGSYSHSFNSSSLKENSDNYSVSLGLNELLFNGLKRYNSYKVSLLDKLGVVQDYYSAWRNMVLNIKDKYYSILLYQNQIKVLNMIKERRKEDLVIIKLKYQSGTENFASLTEMEADLKQSEYNILEKQSFLRTAQISLNLLLARPAGSALELREEETSFPEFDFNKILVKANELSPDINSARIRLQSGQYKLNSARSEFYPELDLNGSYGLSDDKFFPENKSWSIGLSLSLPVFSGFSTVHKVNEIKTELKGLEETLKETENNLQSELQNLWTQYNLLKEKQKLTEIQYNAVLENYKLLKLQYKQGQTTYLILKQKENELSGYEIQKESLKYDMRMALAKLEKYIKELNLEE